MSDQHRPFFRSIGRGIRGHCPACGDGKLFWRYLKVEPRCLHCDHDLETYRADDGPAYITILLAGHFIVAPLLFFPIIWQAPPAVMVPATLIPLAVLTLLLLPKVKGGFIGLLYTLRVRDSDARLHTADVAE
jgi:uncharacterized protein (DUF983 family)